MNTVLLVGGTFSEEGGQPSGVIGKLGQSLSALGFKVGVVNGGRRQDLPGMTEGRLSSIDAWRYDIVIWMPNIPNDWEKVYPKKRKGGVLICSKAMRQGVTRFDAVERIFQMHANAVIEVHSSLKSDNLFYFTLVDALGNEWTKHKEGMFPPFVESMARFVEWTQDSLRVPSIRIGDAPDEVPEGLGEFLSIVRWLAEKAKTTTSSRYFGNASTRCMKMFPSANNVSLSDFSSAAWVSPRNSDKRYITAFEMVLAGLKDSSGTVEYFGPRSPSVDTPVQLVLYEAYPELKYMIHGHLYVRGAFITKNYYPCGDLREVAVINQHSLEGSGVINLKDHGFLMYAESLNELREVASFSEFEILPAWKDFR